MSGALHSWTWWPNDRIQTWWAFARLTSSGISPEDALRWTVAYALLVAGATWGYLRGRPFAARLVYGGLAGACLVAAGSQMIASSLTKLIYETVVCVVALASFGLRHYLQSVEIKGPLSPAAGARLLAGFAKVSLALLAFLAGTVAATVVGVFPREDAVAGRELLRQMILILYVTVGLGFLVFPPLLVRVLETGAPAGNRVPRRRPPRG